MLRKLRRLNHNLKIYSLDDTENIKKYGQKINYDLSSQIAYILKETKIPEKNTIYIQHIEGVYCDDISRNFYDSRPVQIGVCHGRNSKLNSLEFHNCSEILVAMTDLIIYVSHINYLINNTFDSALAEAVFLKEGEIFEIYQTTMHSCPCKVNDDGFMSIIILPDGTNYDLIEPVDDADKLLNKTNRWLIAHNDYENREGLNFHIGITGENLEIKY